MLTMMKFLFQVLIPTIFAVQCAAYGQYQNVQDDLSDWPEEGVPYTLPEDTVSPSTREYWMRRAVRALPELSDGNPCPFAAFAAVIVNHTIDGGQGPGEEVCIGVNTIMKYGNPTLHGESGLTSA
jgi:hypothetical protein